MKSEFSNLKKKIFLEVVVIFGVAICAGFLVLVLFVDGVFEKPFAEGFVNFYSRLVGTDYYSAVDVYTYLFRENKGFLIACGFCLILLLTFYFALLRFRKYFKDINRGIDGLLAGGEQRIRLCPELDFMEDKLNSAKETLRRRERQAQESERRKNELVVYLAHDIRTPLTSVIGYLSLLSENPQMGGELREKYVQVALSKSYDLEQLIDELFELTRYNSEVIHLDKSEINLSMLLMQLADEFFPQLSAAGREILVETPEDITVPADADKLARVFGNILKNAVSYSAPGTVITVRAFREDGHAVVTFENEGVGIPEAQREKIFEKFYRADASRRTGLGNAGLGLAIAKEIVASHGGTIDVIGTDGKTIFRVRLPGA